MQCNTMQSSAVSCLYHVQAPEHMQLLAVFMSVNAADLSMP